MTHTRPIHLADRARTLAGTWSPRVAARVNDVLVKLVRIEGDFVWHSHPDTDEAFLCLSGRVTLHMRDRSVSLEPGELFVIPRGVDHCPHADPGTTVALLEGAGVVNTGGAESALTAPVDLPLDD